ncbi:MAG: hypothetical protein NTV32_04960 [Gammaproteobacteria bacterium]|nr:hypothetical protein [Gammaproteobacteria bacterium]
MRKRINVLMSFLVIAAILFYLCAFEVSQGQVAVGAKDKLYAPGLQFKWPWQKIISLDLSHQIIDLNTAGTNWVVVAAIAQPKMYLKNSAGHSLSDLVKQAWGKSSIALQQDTTLAQDGISVDAVMQTGQTFSDADQAKVIQNMQGLSTQIAQNILTVGEAQAQDIRMVSENSFLATQKQALDLSAQIMGASQAAAVKLLTPLYAKNPALFKAYMQAETQQIKKTEIHKDAR